jgi:hypothetical protein
MKLIEQFFCVGRFQSQKAFEAAIWFIGEIQMTQGPQGVFRYAEMQVECGAKPSSRLDQEDRSTWLDFFELVARR